MALKQDQVDLLMNVFGAFDDDPIEVSGWESSFLTDMKARFDKYGDKTYVSDKQWAAVARIAEKLGVS